MSYGRIYKMDRSDGFVSNIRSQDFCRYLLIRLKSETLRARLYLKSLRLATSSQARYPSR